MKSNVFNRENFLVEQLVPDGNEKLLYILPGGTIPFNLNFTGGNFVLDLRPNAVYEISRIRLITYFFQDTVNDTYAFPDWEQFHIGLNIDAFLCDTNNNPKTTLFTDMAFDLNNGFPEKIFEVPFVFRTDNSSNQRLLINTKNKDSYFTTISGFTIPPAGAPNEPIVIYGQVTLEGVSYSLIQDTVDAQKLQSVNAEAGIEVNNAIDVEI